MPSTLSVNLSETGSDLSSSESFSDSQSLIFTGINSTLHYKGKLHKTSSTFMFANGNHLQTESHSYKTESGNLGYGGMQHLKYLRITNLTDSTPLIFTMNLSTALDDSNQDIYFALNENQSFIFCPRYNHVSVYYSANNKSIYFSDTGLSDFMVYGTDALYKHLNSIYLSSSYEDHFIEVYAAGTGECKYA